MEPASPNIPDELKLYKYGDDTEAAVEADESVGSDISNVIIDTVENSLASSEGLDISLMVSE